MALTLRASNGASQMENEAQQIAQLGRKHGQNDLATKAIAAGEDLAQFRNNLLEAVGNAPLPLSPYVASEPQGYSLGRAIRQQMNGRLDGLEADAPGVVAVDACDASRCRCSKHGTTHAYNHVDEQRG